MTAEVVDIKTGEVVTLMTEEEARRITERIRAALDRVATAWADLGERIAEAHHRRADLALGYKSWAAYAEAELRPSEGVAAEVRRQLVGMLSAQGMSTRAIAPAVGVSQQAVSKTLRRPEVTTGLSPEPKGTGFTPGWRPSDQLREAERNGNRIIKLTGPNSISDPTPVMDGTVVSPSPVIDVDKTGDQGATPPVPRPAITGLDGKTYTRPPVVAPKPRDEVQENAEKAAHNLAHVLNLFADLDSPSMSAHYRDSYRRGVAAVSPAQRELVTPETMRAVAAGLTRLADEWSTK